MDDLNLREAIDRLRPFSIEPERLAMSRGVQFPTVQGRVMSLEQELMRTRMALKEAIDLLEVVSNASITFAGPGAFLPPSERINS